VPVPLKGANSQRLCERTSNFRFIAIPFQENFPQMHYMSYFDELWGGLPSQ